MRSRFLALGIFIAATSVIHADDFKPVRPNIILVLTDDQGYGEMGRHGHPILQTPHMDRFHDESVRFTDFCVSPTCAPSRAAIMTSIQEFNSGVNHTLMPRRNMNRDVTTLPELLGMAGYATGHFGKWHLGLDEAMNWMAKPRDRPFFCFLATYSPHGPQVVPDRYSEPYLDRAASERVAKYFGQIANIDENLGRLMQRLDEQTNAAVGWKSWHLVNQGVVEGCTDDCKNYRRVAKGNQKVLYTDHADIHYRISDGPGWELFDLAADPYQDQDISSQHPDVVGKMSDAYDSWWQKVRPRMIHDPVK